MLFVNFFRAFDAMAFMNKKEAFAHEQNLEVYKQVLKPGV